MSEAIEAVTATERATCMAEVLSPADSAPAAYRRRPISPGDPVFVYGQVGLVTRLEGWAVSNVELFFGDGRDAALAHHTVAVYRDHNDRLDIIDRGAAVALADAEESWHLVSPEGHLVGGGPRTNKPSLTRAELETIRDQGTFSFQKGATAVYGIPVTVLRSPAFDRPPAGEYPTDGGFTGARGGTYR